MDNIIIDLDRNIKVYTFPKLVRPISPFRDMLAFFSLMKFFRKQYFEIIHTHSSKSGFLGRVSAKQSRIGLVVHTVHGFAFPASKNRFQYLIMFFMEYVTRSCIDVLIVLNVVDYDLAVNRLKFLADRVILLPNGIDLAKIKERLVPDANASQLRGPTTVLMIGRLW